MRSTIIRISIVVTALAVVGPALASPQPIVEPAAEPIAAVQAAGLCGITQSDVLDIAAHYDLDPDMPAVQDMLATPFDIEAYGGLSDIMDVQEAHTYACQVWTALEAHVDPTTIQLQAAEAVEAAATTCEPDPEKCADICDPHGVLHCNGIVVGSVCKQLAVCDIPKLRWLLGFKPLIVETL